MRTTPAVKQALVKVAADQDRSVSSLVEQLVRDGLRDYSPSPDRGGVFYLEDAA